jgi:hypothetical protein
LESVNLANGADGQEGDNVGVVTKWQWPDPLAGMTGADFDKAAQAIRVGKWRENAQAKDWAGYAVATALDLDLTDGLGGTNKAVKARIAGMIKVWLAAGSLVIVDGEDEKRMTRKFVEVAEGT